MVRNWDELNARLDYFMDDPDRTEPGGPIATPRFPTILRIMGFNWAQNMLCSHSPRELSMPLVIDRGNRSAVLPDDLYAVDAIYDGDIEQWWRPMRREPGDIRYEDDDLPEYWVWGDRLFMEKDVEYDSTDVTLYYWGYYPEIEYTQNNGEVTITQPQIYSPLWAESALFHLTTAFCWTPGAVMAADINEYKITVDSGNPLQNPRSQQAREHLFWWNVILESHPSPQIYKQARQ